MITRRPFFTTMPLLQPSCDADPDPPVVSRSDGSCVTLSQLSIVSLNMHGFNQGSHTIRDLANDVKPDVVLLQEHWLTPANLYKLEENFPQYVCFCSSAMQSSVESGVLYGRPYGGVAVLVNRKLQYCTEILCCAERFIVVIVGNALVINVYLPSSGTVNRDCIIDDVLCEISGWLNKYSNHIVIMGGDFNTDLDMSNRTSDIINRFSNDHLLHRCDILDGSADKKFTFFNEAQGSRSAIDFFLVNDNSIVSLFEVMDRVCNFSDHVPIFVEISGVCMRPKNDRGSRDVYPERNNSKSDVRQLRWDHANLDLYREITGVHLHEILYDLSMLENCSVVTADLIDSIYCRIVDVLCTAADMAVPSRRRNFFKFWWDHNLDDLKQKSITSCNMWKDMGKPRSGDIFDCYRRDKAAYRLAIRSKQREETENYTNDLHEALLMKQGTAFWKVWGSKFEKKNRTVSNVNGVTDPVAIAEHFSTYFSRACSVNTASGAARLKDEYSKMRVNYCGSATDDSYKFDVGLVESIMQKMKLGKAADLDGITVEHLYYSHRLLYCVLCKLFNLMMRTGHVPLHFGRSYTVPILKNGASVYCKSVTVDDFRGVSISPTISKLFEHCILDRYSDFLITSDNQFGFKKGSSCAHAIYSLRCVVDHYVDFGTTVNICTVDISKAFDKMNHHGLLIKLMKRQIPVDLLCLFEKWFAIGSTCVKWCSFFSGFFALNCGVRQGGVLSPYFFAVLLTLFSRKSVRLSLDAI